MKIGDNASLADEVIDLGIGVCSETRTNEIDDCCELALWYALPDLRTEQWQWMFA